MAFNKHGRVGANIYILILLIVVVLPVIRILNDYGWIYCFVFVSLVSIAAWVNIKTIIRYGSSSVGEMMGLMSGFLIVISSWGGANILIIFKSNPLWIDMLRLFLVVIASFLNAILCKTIGSKFEKTVNDIE